MSVKPIRLFGDPVLRTPAEPVRDFDAELRRLVKDLTETMLDAPGAGLAGAQIGVGLRVFTYHVDDNGGLVGGPTRSSTCPRIRKRTTRDACPSPASSSRCPGPGAWWPRGSTCTATR